jgi:hyperosmotically inducible periplasmic protein
MPPACSRAVVFACLLLAGCSATTAATTDDATIATRVKVELLHNPRVGPMRIDARAFQGVVTLSGTVTSAADVETALGVARKVRGARDVKSDLKIVP